MLGSSHLPEMSSEERRECWDCSQVGKRGRDWTAIVPWLSGSGTRPPGSLQHLLCSCSVSGEGQGLSCSADGLPRRFRKTIVLIYSPTQGPWCCYHMGTQDHHSTGGADPAPRKLAFSSSFTRSSTVGKGRVFSGRYGTVIPHPVCSYMSPFKSNAGPHQQKKNAIFKKKKTFDVPRTHWK